MASEDKAIQQN